MHSYCAFQLLIRSDIALPELVAVDETEADLRNREPDVTIQTGAIDHDFPAEIPDFGYAHFTDQAVYFAWQQVGKFTAQNGRTIIVEPLPEAEERSLRLPLLGSVLAMLLHQRGLLILHASAVAIDGKVAAFVGEKGWGKSTLAATLYTRGHRLLSDDIVAVQSTEMGLEVIPGFPMFKLWPDAVESIGDDPEALPRLSAHYDKRGRRATERFAETPLPLSRVFVLGQGDAIAVKPLSPQEALVQLLPHLYVNRAGRQVLQGAAAARQFHQCTELLKRVTISRLERPRSLALIADTAQLVEQQLGAVLAA